MVHRTDVDGVQVWTCTGQVAVEELAESCHDWVRHPDRPSLLIDLRAAEDLRASSAVMSDLSKTCADPHPPRRIALVADRDLLFGMCRMLEMTQPGPAGRIRCFRNRSEANDWIGLAASPEDSEAAD